MDIAGALKTIRKKSEEYGIRLSGQEQYMIVSEAAGRSLTHVITNKDDVLTREQEANLEKILYEMLVLSKPLEKIVNKAYFYGLEIYVDENVMSPRHDTEILVDRVIGYAGKCGRAPKVLDMFTGSACVAVAVASNCRVSAVAASDISDGALRIARMNVRRHMLEDVISLIRSDIFDDIVDTDFDIIVANPPYITKDEMNGIEKKVLMYDPYEALYGGPDGLDFYRRFFEKAHIYLNDGGAVFCEIGCRQAEGVKAVMKGKYTGIRVFKDHEGRDRVIFGKPIKGGSDGRNEVHVQGGDAPAVS